MNLIPIDHGDSVAKSPERLIALPSERSEGSLSRSQCPLCKIFRLSLRPQRLCGKFSIPKKFLCLRGKSRQPIFLL
jgi:hypothetical protein